MWPSYLGRRDTSGWQLSANCKTITKRAPDPRTQATSRRSTSPAPNLPLIFIGHGTGWRWRRCFRVQLGQEGLAMKSARPTAHPPCRFRLPLVGKSVWFRAPGCVRPKWLFSGVLRASPSRSSRRSVMCSSVSVSHHLRFRLATRQIPQNRHA